MRSAITVPPLRFVRSILQFGDTGMAMLEAQKALGITADGNFGPATLERVKQFQQEHNLTPSGIIDAQTNALLFKQGESDGLD